MNQAIIKNTVAARVTEYEIPPIRDALVLGRDAPIGCQAMRRALTLLVKTPFEHIEIDDPVVSDLLVRTSLLRRISQDRLVGFVLERVKPLMGLDEVLHLELDVEVLIEKGPA